MIAAVHYTPEQAIEHLRPALPDHQGIHQAAYLAVLAAQAELDLELSQPDAWHLARAVVGAVEAVLHLRGFHLAYDTVDRWADSTNRHLIQPAARRAADDPSRAPVLADLQQQYLGICEVRHEVATTLLNLVRRWLDDQNSEAAHQPGDAHRTRSAPPSIRTTIDPHQHRKAPVNLFTSRYQAFHPNQGAAIRTTVGRPRFRLGYPLAGHATTISPMVWMLRIDDEAAYRTVYTDMLATTGPEAIRSELEAIASAAGTDELVLLCFCDLTAPEPGNWCHRRIFAEWWHQRTGTEIPELDGPGHAEPALF